MFEKLTKRFASKATDAAVEGVHESIYDKFMQYSDYVMAGLAIYVVIRGGRHLTAMNRRNAYIPNDPIGLPGYSGYPMIVNNYYQGSREREERRRYEQQYYCNAQGQLQRQAPEAGPGYSRRQNRR